MASLVWGARREIASSSWKAPREMRCVSEEPARRRSGKALTSELPIYKTSILKGPEADCDEDFSIQFQLVFNELYVHQP